MFAEPQWFCTPLSDLINYDNTNNSQKENGEGGEDERPKELSKPEERCEVIKASENGEKTKGLLI